MTNKPKYFAIVGAHTNEIIGLCTDKLDVLREEPNSKFLPLPKKLFDFLVDNDENINDMPEIIELRAKYKI